MIQGTKGSGTKKLEPPTNNFESNQSNTIDTEALSNFFNNEEDNDVYGELDGDLADPMEGDIMGDFKEDNLDNIEDIPLVNIRIYEVSFGISTLLKSFSLNTYRELVKTEYQQPISKELTKFTKEITHKEIITQGKLSSEHFLKINWLLEKYAKAMRIDNGFGGEYTTYIEIKVYNEDSTPTIDISDYYNNNNHIINELINLLDNPQFSNNEDNWEEFIDRQMQIYK